MHKYIRGIFATLAFMLASAGTAGASAAVTDKHRGDGIPAYTKVRIDVLSGAEDNAEKIGSVPAGTVFRYVEREGGFLKVRYQSAYGYVDRSGVLLDKAVTKFARDNPNRFGKLATVKKAETKLYDIDTRKPLAVVQKDTVFLVEDSLDYFYKISLDGTTALVLKEDVETSIYVRVTDFGNDTETVGEILMKIKKMRGRIADGRQAPAAASPVRSTIVKYAMQFVGNPYVWGGTSLTDGADCSGYVQSVLKHFGISVPRCTYDQVNAGKRISLSSVQPGDLVFYMRGSLVGHVAMYIGGGRVVHARGSLYGIMVTDMYYNTPCSAADVISDYLE